MDRLIFEQKINFLSDFYDQKIIVWKHNYLNYLVDFTQFSDVLKVLESIDQNVLFVRWGSAGINSSIVSASGDCSVERRKNGFILHIDKLSYKFAQEIYTSEISETTWEVLDN